MSPHPTHKLVGLWVVALQLWFRIFQLCEWRQKLSFQLVWDPKANTRKKKIMAIGQTPWPVRKIPHGSLSAYWKLKHAWWLWLSDEYILYCNEKKNMWFGEPHGWVMKTYASFILCFPYWAFHFSKIWHVDMFLGSFEPIINFVPDGYFVTLYLLENQLQGVETSASRAWEILEGWWGIQGI